VDIEYLLIFGVGGLLTVYVFSQTSYPFLFMTSLFVLIATVRKGIVGASLSAAIIAIIAIAVTYSGSGPAQLVDGDRHGNVLVAQIFLLFTFASALPFAAYWKRKPFRSVSCGSGVIKPNPFLITCAISFFAPTSRGVGWF
jgi:integral membrane sensor domain MASE1